MSNLRGRGTSLALWAFVVSIGCGSSSEAPPDAFVPADASLGADASRDADVAIPPACDAPTELLEVDEQLASGSEACRTWVDAVRGRVVVSSTASAVIWTTRTPSETPIGVLVSAVHVLGSGWFHTDGSGTGDDIHAFLGAPPDDQFGVMRIRVPLPTGELDRRFVSPQWITYRPDIPAAQHDDITTILPRHDVFVGVVDGHRAEEGLTAPGSPAFGDRSALALHDPRGRASDARTFVDPTPGTLALVMGYPQAGPDGGAFSVARVLGDDEAREAIEWLAARDDEEGTIAYEPEVEVILEGQARVGMSGGGAFDGDGRLIGILVRASDHEAEAQYIRIVRMSHVARLLDEARAALDADARAAVADLLPSTAP